MNDDDKRMFLALVKGKDISEIMSLLAESGNQYSRRIGFSAGSASGFQYS